MTESEWGYLRSALAGALIALLVTAAIPVGAAVGDAVRVGEIAKGNQPTTIVGRSVHTLKLVNTAASEEALNLVVQSGPALRVNTNNRIRKLNADMVDGRHAAALEVPSGAVMYFDRSDCPSGWTPYEPARGRAVVGLSPGGTLGGVQGSPYGNLEGPTATGGSHNHAWVYYDQTAMTWRTWDDGGDIKYMVDYSDGIGGEGAGNYPIAPHNTDEDGSGVVTYFTPIAGSHSHAVDVPYVQLLACRKN